MDKSSPVLEALLCGRSGCNCQKARLGKGNVHCPAHDDKEPSLSVGKKGGTLLVHCHGGCSQETVIESLRKQGLWPEPRRNDDSPQRRTRGNQTRHEWRDSNGHLVAVHVRKDGPNGKEMWWERPDGSKGLGGLAISTLPLYGSETLSALADGDLVVLTEGEKAADALRSVGVNSVGTVTGAAGTPGDDAIGPLLRLGVVLWADNDDSGRQHMVRIAARLTALGCEDVRWLDWPDAPPKGDAADAVIQSVDVQQLIVNATDWKPSDVNLAGLLDDVATFYRRFVVLSKEQADTLALWSQHTHAIAAAETTLYVHVSSAEKESGKTRTGEVASLVVAKPLSAESISPAALARSIDMGITMILDEVDTFFKKGNGSSSESVERMLKGVLDSGWRRGGQYVRMVGQGANMVPHGFSTFGAKMLIGIGDIPGTLGSRSVRIVLRRRRRDTESIERFRIRKVTREADALRSSLAEWAAAHVEELRETEPDIPDKLSDRMADSWEPLIAIADLAGLEWPRRARNAAGALSSPSAVEDESTGVRLLSDLRPFLGERPCATATLLEYLNALEESSWGTWNEGTGMRPQNLARILRPFSVKPRTIRLPDGCTLKGYYPSDFQDSFARYLPCHDKITGTPSHNANDGVFQSRFQDDVTTPSQMEARYICDGVTVKPPKAGVTGPGDTNGQGEREVLEL